MINENRGFVLTVVLVLVAAIVAGNFAIKPARTASPITPTGYVTLGQGCTWQEARLGGYIVSSMCPSSRPNVVAGGCAPSQSGISIQASAPVRGANFTTEGWQCSFSVNSYHTVYANCCR